MDEFDKIREISEDLTHRREPTFTQLSQLKSGSTSAGSSVGTNTPSPSFNQSEQTQRVNPFLNQSVQPSIDSEKDYRFTPEFNDKVDFIHNDFVGEKSFSSMKFHIIGLSVFAGILGIVLAGFFFFNGESDAVDEIVTITTAPDIVKESPKQAGGMKIPDQDKLVYNRIRSDNVATKVESLFPEPEKPVMPQILEINEEKQEEDFVSMKNVQAVNPLNEAARPIMPVQNKTVKEEQLGTPLSSIPVQKKTAESTQPKIETVKSEQPKPSVVPLLKEKKEEKTEAKSVKQPTIQEAKKSGNVWRVQLFATNNKEAVEKAWKRILTAHKSLLSDMSYVIEPAQIKGKGTFYRLKVGQFSSRDMASALCAKLKAKKQDCVPTK